MGKRIFLITGAIFLCTSIIFSFSDYQKSLFIKAIRSVDSYVNIGVYILSPKQPCISYEKHIDRHFRPASCTKLFTAAAILHELGAEYRYKTDLLFDGRQQGNTLLGNVYLKAAGDPSFTRQDLEVLIIQLKSRGIVRIQGDICIDSSLFDGSRNQLFAAGVGVDDIGKRWNASTTALIIDRNLTKGYDGYVIAREDPYQYAQQIIKDTLQAQAIVCSGKIHGAQVPQGNVQVLAQHISEPIHELIAHMLKVSDNVYANAMFKLLGAKKSGLPGTWQNGIEAMQAFLKTTVGIDSSNMVIADGAGLSLYNLITPRQVVHLLDWIYKQSKFFELFADCLAISGIDGTLKERLVQYPGIIKAKTGTLLCGVTSLSGYFCPSKGAPIIFSIMTNNFINNNRCSYKEDIEDKLCSLIVEFCCTSDNSAHTCVSS